MDFESFDLKLQGSDSMAWRITRKEDHSPVVRQNLIDKKNGTNGWTPGHRQRRLARIPIDVINWAISVGYDMSGKGVYKFLADHPEYLTVPYVLTPNNGSAVSQGKVIIK